MNLRNKFRQPRFEKALADLVAKYVLGQQRGIVPQDRHLLFRCHLVGKQQAKLSGREDIIGQGWVVQRLSGGDAQERAIIVPCCQNVINRAI